MDAFHSGQATTLVATDIAARGIHVDDVALVVHADPPAEHKAYLHRSGRTARAGASGTVITLMTDEQVRDVRDLTRAAGIKPTITKIDGAAHPVLAQLAPGERVLVAGQRGPIVEAARAAPVAAAVVAPAVAVAAAVAVAPVAVAVGGRGGSGRGPAARQERLRPGTAAQAAVGRSGRRRRRSSRVAAGAAPGRRPPADGRSSHSLAPFSAGSADLLSRG